MLDILKKLAISFFSWFCFVFIFTVSLPLYFIALICKNLERLYFLWRHDGVSVPCRQIVWSIENKKNQPFITGVIITNGEIFVNDIKRCFQDIIERNPNEYKLTHYVIDGFFGKYWIKDEHFSINNHIFSSSNTIMASQLPSVVGQATTYAYTNENEHPKWRIYVQPFKEESTIKSALVFHLSHIIGDGASLSYFLSKHVCKKEIVPIQIRKNTETNYYNAIFYGLLSMPTNLYNESKFLLTSKPLLRDKVIGQKTAAWSNKISLLKIKVIKERLHCTVNEVLVGILATVVTKHYNKHNLMGDVITLIPVDVRSSCNDVKFLDNAFVPVAVKLAPLSENVYENIDYTKKRFDEIKGFGLPISLSYAFKYTTFLMDKGTIERFVHSMADNASTVSSNMIGPQYPISLLGCNIDKVIFWPPTMFQQNISFSFYSYDHAVVFAVLKDTSSPIDVDSVIANFEETLDNVHFKKEGL